MTTEQPTLRCNCCRCLISQDEADRGARLFASENTLCPECAKSAADDLATEHEDAPTCQSR